MFEPKNENFQKQLYTKYMKKYEAMTSSTHSLALFISTVQEMFHIDCTVQECSFEIMKIQNIFLNFYPIFIKFSLSCSIFFLLSIELT